MTSSFKIRPFIPVNASVEEIRIAKFLENEQIFAIDINSYINQKPTVVSQRKNSVVVELGGSPNVKNKSSSLLSRRMSLNKNERKGLR